MSVVVKIDNIEVVGKLQSAEFGTFVAKEWKRLIDPYTPLGETGGLQSTAIIEPFAITYGPAGTNEERYASYMYNGIVKIDPVYKVGGFFSEKYGWWSRRGVTKVLSGRPFNFTNPMATDHWDEKAEAAGQVDKLVQIINSALNSGRF